MEREYNGLGQKEKQKREEIWNQVLQNTFTEMTRMWSTLVVTLTGVGIITAIFILFFVSTPVSEESMAVLLHLFSLVSVISVVVGVLSIRKMRTLKKRFQSGDMAIDIAKKSL